MRFYIFFTLIVASLFACTPPEYNQTPIDTAKLNLDLRNPAIQRLYDFKDKRLTDSLERYLRHQDVTLRYIATLAYASIRDTNAIDVLALLLKDVSEEVRTAAAFSLGQMGHKRCESLLVAAFRADDSLSVHQRYNAIVLEAIGKCGTASSLKYLTEITTYKPTDTLLYEGLCRAIYQFGLRGVTLPEGTSRMVNTVSDGQIPAAARLLAAHYLARTKDITLDSTQAVKLAVSLVRATDFPELRMAIAKGLGKSVTQPAFGILSKVVTTEQDWRVQVNIIQALAKFDYDTVRNIVSQKLFDPNPHVSRTAAEFFVQNGQVKDADYFWRIAQNNQSLPVSTQIPLYHASNKLLSGKNEPESKDFVNYRLKEIYQQAKSPYDKAACIAALSEFGWNYRWIYDRATTEAHPAIKSAVGEALMNIAQKPNFFALFGEGAKNVRRELYYMFRNMVQGGDPGLVVGAAEGFRSKVLSLQTMRDSTRAETLQASLSKLKMPRDVEAYMALEKAIAFFDAKPEPAPYKPTFNHPIDWERLKLVTNQTEATIETEKGNIVIVFYPEIAPGSVINFVALAAKGDFDGKNFHRIVPNFVVQGGCPRGDGYGAFDYTIRTEIGMTWYDAEGYVGMASAGFDTEGTQFFITHSPTPHLDGKYTIFGKVKSGMDVVNRILPGDVMRKVTVKY